jgi:uncharacterized phage protein gp47/JayE
MTAALFQTEDFPTIVAGMVNSARASQKAITDFTVGSRARTLLEAAASQIDECYQQVTSGLLASIPVATFQSFGFPALAAMPASGVVNITITAQAVDLVIAAGTICQPVGLSQTYQTASSLTIVAGHTTGTVVVTAVTPGAAANIAANRSFIFTPVPQGFLSASNAAAFVSGQDAETPQAQLVRFAAYINALQRCNVAGIEYGLSQVALTDALGNVIEQVKFVFVYDPVPSPGSPPQAFAAYVHNGVGQTSSGLVAQAQKVVNGYVNDAGMKVPGYKAAGIPCTVYAAADLVLTIGGAVSALPGFVQADLVAPVKAAVANYVLSLNPGSNFILAQAYKAVMAVPGVYDWVPSALTVNTLATAMGDVTAAATQKFVPGVMTIA